MSQKTTTTYYDDIDGKPLTDTDFIGVEIGLDGKSGVIDLRKKNKSELDRIMEPYLKYARRVGTTKPRSQPRRDRATPKKIRAWAAEQGIEMPERGRIPLKVMIQYKEAHK